MELVHSKATEATPFDELAGRIEGVARAVLELSRMLDAQADIDGQALAARWRRSVAPGAAAPCLATARRTLQELAAELDQARARRTAQAGCGTGAARIRPPPVRLVRA